MSALQDVSNAFRMPPVLSDVGRGLLPVHTPTVLSGAMAVPVSRLGSETLTILISDFNLAINAPVLELRQDQGAGKFSLRLAIVADVEASIAFEGSITENGESFEISEVLFRLAPREDKAQADFVASTLNAALSLSHRVQVQMPKMNLDLALGFELPLIEISRLLQSRQNSYRLMTIERATGVHFDLPPRGFSGEDIAAIVFVFRAIIERVFTYHLINGIPLEIDANAEGAKRLRSLEGSGVIAFGPEMMSKRLLGVEIPLGMMTVKIEDPYIEEIERVREEIATGDGHPVTTLVRSATNQALFELPDAPRLPSDPWGKRIQAMIDLDRELDSRLIERYHALAASTLAGLSEEEKIRVTRRVELDDDTFLIDQVEQPER